MRLPTLSIVTKVSSFSVIYFNQVVNGKASICCFDSEELKTLSFSLLKNVDARFDDYILSLA